MEAVPWDWKLRHPRQKSGRRAVAEYACNHPGNFGDEQFPVANWTSNWEKWLQTNRANSTP